MGFDGVLDGDQANENFAFRGRLRQVILTSPPNVFGEAIDPFVSFIIWDQGLGWVSFEVSHDAAKSRLYGGVGRIECRFPGFYVACQNIFESPDGHLKFHYKMIEARVVHHDLFTHGRRLGLVAFFGQMSFDQTGVRACLAPWVTRPLPAKKSTKVGGVVFMSSFEQVSGVESNLECLRREWVKISKI